MEQLEQSVAVRFADTSSADELLRVVVSSCACRVSGPILLNLS
jgi:hypothetical protein